MIECMNNRTRSDSISLSLLIKEINGIIEHVFGDLEKEIVSVEYNSKDAVKNCLFVAVSGFVSDGHDYVRDAVDRGAVAVVISKEWMSEFDDLKDHGITLLSSRNTRRALSYISASFFRYPTSKVPVIGVTGTNGKTSVTYMLESILKKYGLSPGVIGTVNYRWENNILNASNTTPESRDLQEIFSYMIRDGVDVIVMEVSSHALKLFRVDDIEFDAVIFTNLTRDHLDFHDTFDEYFNSKRKIFQILERSSKKNKCAVVNIDDDYGRLIFNKDKGFSYLMKSFGVAEPGLLNYLIFAGYFVLAKFSVAAVPGGGILVMLPILERYLGFDPVMLSLITALYILFDPIVTSANVLGNGCFAMGLSRVSSPYVKTN